jgi:tetratricopeptide (TPR) repeat protein
MRRHSRVPTAALTILCVAAPALAVAQRPRDIARCEGTDRPMSLQTRINACTTLIESGSVTELRLARMFILRAAAHDEAGDRPRAIADLTQAIALNPQDVSSLQHRGTLYFESGDFDSAIRDYDRIVDLSLTRLTTLYAVIAKADALLARSTARAANGDAEAAAADIEAAQVINADLAAAPGRDAQLVRMLRLIRPRRR